MIYLILFNDKDNYLFNFFFFFKKKKMKIKLNKIFIIYKSIIIIKVKCNKKQNIHN